ncbi:MAG: bifunctional enoyl-CoA hydratase/phosphate acetyltransferase [bacterium]|nr:bifunctional enoyl-CoA hydratase/phosphate acetyltransferase [bacterium]
MIQQMSDIYKSLENRDDKKTLVVPAAQDEHVLDAVVMARDKGIIDAVLIGNEKKIKKIANRHSYDLSGMKIINEEDMEQSAALAVQKIHEGEGDILMKGNLDSSVFLRPILSSKSGLRTSDVISHLSLLEMNNYHKIFALTDAAINIAPDLRMKVAIIRNAVMFMKRLGIETPKVAALGAVEVIMENMPATIESAALSMMAQRGQIKDCIIDGPLSLDNAISKKSAEYKGIENEVAGDPDIFLCHNLETGNILYKSFVYFAKASPACIIIGASVPIILTSRADSEQIKLNSIALAASVDIS